MLLFFLKFIDVAFRNITINPKNKSNQLINARDAMDADNSNMLLPAALNAFKTTAKSSGRNLQVNNSYKPVSPSTSCKMRINGSIKSFTETKASSSLVDVLLYLLFRLNINRK